MLMSYEGEGGRREWIWNSRDGITPFSVRSADGLADLQHANFHLDRYEPLHVPVVGARVFVDLTEELARPLAITYVDHWWNDANLPMVDHPQLGPMGKDAAAEYFIAAWISEWSGHAPHVVTVSPALHEQFKARAAAPIT